MRPPNVCGVPELDASPYRAAIRRSLMIAALAAASVAVFYIVFVRTKWGQEIDDLAFEGRHAAKLESTRRLNRMLNAVTESSLFLLGGAIVLIAFAQRRIRLVFVVGASMSMAVLTTEVLKLKLLTRPVFSDVQGIPQNSYPSGHATIGMVLSLGLVMVSTSGTRRWAAALAALLSTAFGTAVLASGWHRPSDSLGAYGVALAWFAAGNAVLLWSDWRHPYAHGMASDADRAPSRGLLVGAAVAMLGFLGFALFRSLQDQGLQTVAYARAYVLACLIIDVLGVGVVLLFSVMTGRRARRRRDEWPQGA